MNYSYLDASSTFLLLDDQADMFCWNRAWVNARLTVRVQLVVDSAVVYLKLVYSSLYGVDSRIVF